MNMLAASTHSIIERSDRILITGANGFIGSKVVETLLIEGFTKLRCLVRSSGYMTNLKKIIDAYPVGVIKICEGNLLSRDVCRRAVEGASVVYHLAAGRGEKSYPDAFMNSVVTTRNLLEATTLHKGLTRFVNISSFAVYTNTKKPQWRVLDESCPVETRPELRGEAYCFAKVKQEEIVTEYGKKFGIPCVIARPGVVYGPGNEAIHGRVGIGTFGVFLHLGGSNAIPLT